MNKTEWVPPNFQGYGFINSFLGLYNPKETDFHHTYFSSLFRKSVLTKLFFPDFLPSKKNRGHQGSSLSNSVLKLLPLAFFASAQSSEREEEGFGQVAISWTVCYLDKF